MATSNIILVLDAICFALMAEFPYSYSCSIVLVLASLPDAEYILAMQSIKKDETMFFLLPSFILAKPNRAFQIDLNYSLLSDQVNESFNDKKLIQPAFQGQRDLNPFIVSVLHIAEYFSRYQCKLFIQKAKYCRIDTGNIIFAVSFVKKTIGNCLLQYFSKAVYGSIQDSGFI